VEDTWANRDLPVLDATVRLLETSYFLRVSDIAAAAGMDIETTARALEALDGTYVDLSISMGGPESGNVRAVRAEARRAVGQWPTAESLITRLVEAFSAAAEQEPDPEKKSRLRSIAGMLGGAGYQIAVDVAARVVEHQIPGMG
jgi:hypothetical protein